MDHNPQTTSPALRGDALTEIEGFGPPLHRAMTEDEQRGFNWALQAQQRWGRIMLTRAAPLAGPEFAPIPLQDATNHGWKMVVNCARALELTMGRAA